MKLLAYTRKTVGCMLLLAIVSLTNGGCSMSATHNATETSENSLAIPALHERTGELARTEEWARTKEKVTEFIQAIAANPNDVKPRLQLATIYIAEARITGEHPYYYPAILKILDGVLRIQPDNFEGMVLKSSVKMSQHKFREARELATGAMRLNPANAYVYGVLVDANVELGNYKEAVAMSDKMQSLKPSLESYSRASYLREIHGDYDGAIYAMSLAVQAGLLGSEPQSWSRNTLAYLYEKTGRLDKAEKEYKAILGLRPSYAFALKGLADVYCVRKEYGKALEMLTKAADIMPEFSFYEKMADIYIIQGTTEQATKAYKEVLVMLKEDEQSGHSVNLELARVHLKLGNIEDARRYAMAEYKERPNNIDVNEMLAWISYEANEVAKAHDYMQAALVTGSKDPQLLWRASQVEASMGNRKDADRLLAWAKQTNPQFETLSLSN